MESQVIFTALGFFVLGGGLGLVLGRRAGGDSRRAGELEQQLVALRHEMETLQKDRERAIAEGAAAREEVAAGRKELERVGAQFAGFQGDVVEHFSGTSHLVRDLTLQYRSVISHLTDGVGKLCPEGSLDIAEGMRLASLPDVDEQRDDVIETSAFQSEALEENQDGEQAEEAEAAAETSAAGEAAASAEDESGTTEGAESDGPKGSVEWAAAGSEPKPGA